MPSLPGPPSAGTESDGAICAQDRDSIDLRTFWCDVNVTSVSGVIERKPTGRTDKAETLSPSWKKHHQLAGKLRKLFWKVTSENILLLRDPSSIYWESASWEEFLTSARYMGRWRVLPYCSPMLILLEKLVLWWRKRDLGLGHSCAVLFCWCGRAMFPLSSSFVTVMDCSSLCGFLLSCLSPTDKNSLVFFLSVNIQQAA